MSKRTYEVVAVTGKYTNSEGEEKSRYLTIGAVIEGKNGPMLKLEAVPVGWDGWAYLNEPRAKEDQPKRGNTSSGRRQTPQPVTTDGFEDENIPFVTNRGAW